MKANALPVTDFVVLSERAAREYCKVLEVEYAPVDGKQLVGGVLLHIINPSENPLK